MTESTLLPKLEQSIFTTFGFEIPKEPTNPLQKQYTIQVDQDGERFIGTCLELDNVFVNGIDTEDVMRRIRIVIEEFLQYQGTPDKNFNLSQLVIL